ncbi:ComF family protein [Nesterenkonia populi]
MRRVLEEAWQQALDLVLPQQCVGCAAPAAALCRDCAEDLRVLCRRPFWAHHAAEALPVIGTAGAHGDGIEVLPVLSAARYDGLVAEAMVAFKDHERVKLASALGPALGRAVHQAAAALLAPEERCLLVCPPDSLSARLRRGRVPLRELLSAADLPDRVEPAFGVVGRPARAQAASLKPGSAQKARSARSRRTEAAQLSLAPAGRRMLPGAQVLLVDDVLTTGSTLKHLYETVTEAGAEVRGGIVLAAAPR